MKKDIKNNLGYLGNKNAFKKQGVGYSGIHHWINKECGKPKKCEHCKSTNQRIYDWANISGDYLRDKKDWIRLCRSCHIFFDKKDRKKPKYYPEIKLMYATRLYTQKDLAEMFNLTQSAISRIVNKIN
jgi:predicted transcriptional regulator